MNVRRCISYCSNGEFSSLSIVSFQGFFSASQRRLHQWTLTADRGLLENSPPVNGDISEAGDFCQDVSNCAAQWWVMFPSKKSWLNCWRFWNDDQLTRDCYFEMYRNDHLPPYLLSLYKSHFSLFYTHFTAGFLGVPGQWARTSSAVVPMANSSVPWGTTRLRWKTTSQIERGTWSWLCVYDFILYNIWYLFYKLCLILYL